MKENKHTAESPALAFFVFSLNPRIASASSLEISNRERLSVPSDFFAAPIFVNNA